MKKIILVFALLFVSNSFLSATNKDLNLSFNDCTNAAWDFGTEFGGSDEDQYDATNIYYEIFCDDNGHYKLDFVSPWE